MREGHCANCLIDEHASDRGFDSPVETFREILGYHRSAKRNAGTMLEHHGTEPAERGE